MTVDVLADYQGWSYIILALALIVLVMIISGAICYSYGYREGFTKGLMIRKAQLKDLEDYQDG